MSTPKDVLIAGERHLIILGQFGNLGTKLSRLKRFCIDAEFDVLAAKVREIVEELDYLKKVYPQIDGSFETAAVKPDIMEGSTDSPKINQALRDTRVRNSLRDMRALIDAAYATYTHEGSIDCHLKVMFDHAWREAADQVGLSRDELDDAPF